MARTRSMVQRNELQQGQLTQEQQEELRNRMFECIRAGDLKCIQDALRAGANVNGVSPTGITLLIAASFLGRFDIVKELIRAGADVNLQDIDGKTALIAASAENKLDIVKELIKAGVDLHIKSNEHVNALLYATKFNHLEIVKELIKAGIDVNSMDRNGENALLKAIKNNNLEIVKELIKAGIDINSMTNTGDNALFMAIIKRNLEIVKELIKAEIDIDIQYNNNDTALMVAISYNTIEIVKELLKAGADVNIQNKDGDTALIEAIITLVNYHDVERRIHLATEIVKELIKGGANINLTNIDGETAVYIAADNDEIEVLRELLSVPTLDTTIQYNGKTILQLAKQDAFSPDINSLIIEKLSISQAIWKGWTRADVEQMNTIFDADGANNYAYCPICLKYVSRADGCMYMSHDCSKMPGYYNKGLYTKYKTSEGNIYWCTICGRIALGHRHYTLAAANGPVPTLSTGAGNPFEIDCRLTNGGGGLPEKLARFRRLREYALELQEGIGKIAEEEAIDDLVEAAWNAPLAKSKKYERMLASKIWNIKNTNFPEPARPVNIPANRPNNVTPNIKRPEPNASNVNLQPLKLNRGTNNLYGDEDVEVIQFRHRKADGTINTHEDAKISVDNFVSWLDDLTKKDFGTERFGFCFMYPACNARLYPEEVKPFVSDDLYKEYKQKFNRKFGAATGGRMQRGGGTFFVEATNATCVLPSKKGGKRFKKTRKGKRGSKRTKSTRKH